MQVGVLGGVDLNCVLVQALAPETGTLKVTNPTEGGGRIAANKVCATVGDAAVGVGLGSARVAGAGVSAELGRDAALAPDVTAGVQRTGLRSASFVPSVGGLVPGICGPHLASGNSAGMGGSPSLKQMFMFHWRPSHPLHAQVSLLDPTRLYYMSLLDCIPRRL